MTELRGYQSEAVTSVFDYWADNGGNPLVDMATGTGKSLVLGTVAKEAVQRYPDMRVLVLAHVKELIAQNVKALLHLWSSAPIGINSAGLGRRDKRSQILFANIQSVHRKPELLGPRDLVLIDEAHLVPREGEGMYLRLLERLRDTSPDMRVAGFSATCYRMDVGRLDEGDGRLFDRIVYTYGIADGVRDGYLSPLISYGTATEINVAGVARRGGEFVAGALEAAADRAEIINGACDELVARASDRRGWLAFCSGVEHAGHVCDALRQRGIESAVVTGDTPNGERDRIFNAYRAGHIRALCGANVFTTGFDVPHVDCIAMLRPTLSTGLYVQMCGRGTRLAPGKSNCLVLDYAGNVRRHGPVDDISVAPRVNVARDENEAAVKVDSVRAKVCPVCETYNGLAALMCQTCGHEWPKPAPKHEIKPDHTPIMASQGPQWVPVSAVSFFPHEKDGGLTSLRVEYRCGMQNHREWVCFNHKGFPRYKAECWWRALAVQTAVPASVMEAIQRKDELHTITHVTLKREGKYWRVGGWRTANGFDVDEKFRVTPTPVDVEAAPPAPITPTVETPAPAPVTITYDFNKPARRDTARKAYPWMGR